MNSIQGRFRSLKPIAIAGAIVFAIYLAALQKLAADYAEAAINSPHLKTVEPSLWWLVGARTGVASSPLIVWAIRFSAPLWCIFLILITVDYFRRPKKGSPDIG